MTVVRNIWSPEFGHPEAMGEDWGRPRDQRTKRKLNAPFSISRAGRDWRARKRQGPGGAPGSPPPHVWRRLCARNWGRRLRAPFTAQLRGARCLFELLLRGAQSGQPFRARSPPLPEHPCTLCLCLHPFPLWLLHLPFSSSSSATFHPGKLLDRTPSQNPHHGDHGCSPAPLGCRVCECAGLDPVSQNPESHASTPGCDSEILQFNKVGLQPT